jgi:hypothetical protein
MENVAEWHHRIPTEAECERALGELGMAEQRVPAEIAR